MPWRAWLRAFVCVIVGAVPLIALLRASIQSSGWIFAASVTALLAWGGLITFVAWIFLPDVDRPGRTFRRRRRGGGRIAITFDDGPNADHTGGILDVLQKHQARATFFCVGAFARRHPELVARMVREGHEVGNHTLEHALLPRLPKDEVRRQLEGAQAAIMEAGAPRPRLFRAPKGFKSPHLGGVLRQLDLKLVGWTRGVWDTDRPGVDAIVRRATASVRDGAVLLLHDGLDGKDRSQTAQALDRILAICASRNLTAVTVGELMQARPAPLGARSRQGRSERR